MVEAAAAPGPAPEVAELGPLPVAAKGRHSVGWWGMLTLIATEASLFAYLLFAFGYSALQGGPDFSPEPRPNLMLALPNTAVLLASSATAAWGEQGVMRGRRGQHLLGLAATLALGAVFLVVQLFEWKAKRFGPTDGTYGSFYFTITGFHMAHVAVGLLVLTTVFAWSLAGLFNPRRHESVSNAVIYWHFVDAVWLAVFSAFYIAPYFL